MESVDIYSDERRAWLQQQMRADMESAPQSNFEQSPYWRFCFCVALIVIGIQVFSPEPVPLNPAAANASHSQPMV
ncbi:hypothetical protein AB4Y43_07075 [Paraburkholderia sp. BR10872]|uniref:hypothetical protein n=1 Tax=Paraburkholderia sp. BR10872 TaxID=3236989 RepID=UPI0034D28195